MSFKYTSTTLEKMERIFERNGYGVRYEKGNFKAGYCLLLAKKVVVVNKFFDTESRINCLIEILPEIQIEEALLEENLRDLYQKITPVRTAIQPGGQIRVTQ